MNSRNTEWAYDEVETLRRMVAEGNSFSQIGKALGRTRCMISGKAHRMGLTYVGRGLDNPQAEEKKARDEKVANLFNEGVPESQIAFMLSIDRETVHRSLVRSGNKQKRIPGIKKVREPRKPRVARPMNGYNFHNGKVKVWRSTYYESTVEPNGPLIAFLDLEPQHCRFPHGEPGTDGFGFCGADKIDGSSYCVHHSLIAYREPRKITEHERQRRIRFGRMLVASGAWTCGFKQRRAVNGV